MTTIRRTRFSRPVVLAALAQYGAWVIATLLIHPGFWGAVAMLGVSVFSSHAGRVMERDDYEREQVPQEPKLR